MIPMKQHILIPLGLAVLCLHSASADSWQIIASPNGPRQVNELHSVSALAENDVWEVGVSYNTERTLGSTLIEHWNGSRWSVVPSPNPSSSVNMINAVAAVSANDVRAVGPAPPPTDTVLILHRNGTAWSVVPNPTNGIPLANLTALAVISANDIWAVGSGFIGDEGATATLHWNGTAWSVIPSPNVGPEVDNSLAGVAAASSNDVWAVGTQQPTNLTDPSTLIQHWDGSAWTIVPNISPEGSHLQAASGVASNDVWATGYSEAGTLAEHWDGSSWSVVQTANGGPLDPVFLPGAVGLSCNNVWMDCEALQAGHLSRTLTWP